MRAFLVLVGILGTVFNTSVLEAGTPKFHPYVRFPNQKAKTNALSATWTVPQLCQAYNFLTDLTANGIIGILEFSDSNNPCGYFQDDLDAFSAMNNMPTINVTSVSVDGIGQNDPGVDINADAEVALDIQCAAAAYYYCTGTMPKIYVFFMSNTLVGGFEPVMQAAAANNCDVLSISWGANEKTFSQFAPGEAQKIEAAAQAASAAGVTIFAASGDSSSSDGSRATSVDVPSSCPHVIGCGGTSKAGSTEVVWGDGKSTDWGTGGGFSAIFASQSFQVGAPKPPSKLGRMVPDVAADADPNTGIIIVLWGAEIQIGGTSCVAPLYAGLFASLGKKLGFVTPALWQNKSAFVDITTGSNGAYKAGTGPDPCTGLGVPNGAVLAVVIANIGKLPPLPSKVTATFSNGTLTITGDATANGVNVTYTPTKKGNKISNGSITVAAINSSTQINGTSSVKFSNIGKNPFAVIATMNSGDDVINFNSLFCTTCNISLGDGNDTATFNLSSISTQLTLDGGPGTDTVTYTATTVAKSTVTNVP